MSLEAVALLLEVLHEGQKVVVIPEALLPVALYGVKGGNAAVFIQPDDPGGDELVCGIIAPPF